MAGIQYGKIFNIYALEYEDDPMNQATPEQTGLLSRVQPPLSTSGRSWRTGGAALKMDINFVH